MESIIKFEIGYREERGTNRKLKIFNGLPLSRNRYIRLHEMARHVYNKQWYELIGQYLMQFKNVKFKYPVHFVITLYLCGNMPDSNNPEDKPIIDAFVKAGIIKDDSLDYMPRRPEFLIIPVEHRDQQKMVVEMQAELL